MHRAWLVALCACAFTPGQPNPSGPDGNPGAPPTPTGLAATAVTCNQISLAWSAPPGATGYTVYRDGAVLASTTATTYVDDSVAATTTYGYAIDATSAAGHSAVGAVASVTTPACTGAAIVFVQATTHQTGGSSIAFTLSAVTAGDLLVGWFLNYESTNQIAVGDDVNGAWTRGCAEHYDGGTRGDAALYYIASSAGGDLHVTASAGGATYIQTSAAEYAGTAASSPLDQCIASNGTGATGTAGPTAALAAANELVFAATVNGAPQTTMTAGSGFTLRANDSNDGCEDGIAATTAAQTATLAFSSSPDWNMVVATFLPGP